jgi:hypothetical protein
MPVDNFVDRYKLNCFTHIKKLATFLWHTLKLQNNPFKISHLKINPVHVQCNNINPLMLIIFVHKYDISKLLRA